ncbi:IS1595 family transposase [Aurantiacibacter hainanensis]|uniref:IS1595 family transposase n=1 Tax=Aurantiacibacter hainanensis TaxID=3076114 RepID=UPI0030C6848D
MELHGPSDVARFLADEEAAQNALAELRWPNGQVACPFCDGGEKKKVWETCYESLPSGKKTFRRQWKCAACCKKFSVTSRTIFDKSRISIGKWFHAINIMCVDKKGLNSAQLARELHVRYKSAWFMLHRLRQAMLQEPLASILSRRDSLAETDYRRVSFHGLSLKDALIGLLAIPDPYATKLKYVEDKNKKASPPVEL